MTLLRQPHRPTAVTLVLGLLAALTALVGPLPAAATGDADAPSSAPAATDATVPVYRVDRDPLTAATRSIGEPFALFGLHLSEAPAEELHVRFHQPGGGWGPWLELPGDHGPDPGTGEGQGDPAFISEPVWVGEADGWELDGGAARLPTTGGEAVLVRATGRTDPVTAATADPTDRATVAGPTIRSRSAWGAAPYRGVPEVADHLQLAVVHHTVTANDYTPGQVPGIIRAVQAFHQDGNGWDDLAYNFVVDRFGTIWEGRAGGIDRAVIGGHAKGFNTGSTGVVALGEFSSVVPSTAMVDAIGSLLGWKLFVHGVDPDGRVDFTSYGNETYPAGRVVDLPRVSGHRDTGATACPGNHLYDRLGVIRVGAIEGYDARVGAGTFTSRPVDVKGDYTPLPGDFDGDGATDIVWYGPGAAKDGFWLADGRGGFSPRPLTVSGTYQPLVADFDGDWVDDIFWYGPGTAHDSLWLARGDGTFRTVPVSVKGTYTPVVGEFTGDDAQDILWYAPGTAHDAFWQGTTRGAFIPRAVNVRGIYRPLVGDFDGDWVDDIFWYAPGTATDAVWLGRSKGRFSLRLASVSGTYDPSVGDLDGDGRDDIFWFGPGTAYDSLWFGGGGGGFGVAAIRQDDTRPVLLGDFTGGGLDDLLWADPSLAGQLWRSVGPGQFQTRAVDRTVAPTPILGDFDRDARLDVLWYGGGAPADALWLAD